VLVPKKNTTFRKDEFEARKIDNPGGVQPAKELKLRDAVASPLFIL
jgi:hypothetical protein